MTLIHLDRKTWTWNIFPLAFTNFSDLDKFDLFSKFGEIFISNARGKIYWGLKNLLGSLNPTSGFGCITSDPSLRPPGLQKFVQNWSFLGSFCARCGDPFILVFLWIFVRFLYGFRNEIFREGGSKNCFLNLQNFWTILFTADSIRFFHLRDTGEKLFFSADPIWVFENIFY